MVKVLQPFAVPHVGTHLEGQGMVAMNLEVWRWTRPIKITHHDGWKIHIILINSKIVTQVKTCENYFWFSRCSKILLCGNCKFRQTSAVNCPHLGPFTSFWVIIVILWSKTCNLMIPGWNPQDFIQWWHLCVISCPFNHDGSQFKMALFPWPF